MKASRVTFITMVGAQACREREPVAFGNCFGVACDDGGDRRVVNFCYENLKELMRLGLTFPIEIKPLTDHHAILLDPRIGERWYPTHYCEVCCPRNLLPCSQRDVHEREIARGRREEHAHSVQVQIGPGVLPGKKHVEEFP